MLKVTVLPFRTTPPAVRLREAVRSTTSPDLPLTVRLVGAAVTVKVPAPEVAAAAVSPANAAARVWGPTARVAAGGTT